MSYTWADIMGWLKEWFTAIFPVFQVEILDGVTFFTFLAAVFVIMFTVSIITWFVSNTHGSLGAGGYVENTVTNNKTRKQILNARARNK